MGRTLETAAVETKSSLPLLTTYRPLRPTVAVDPKPGRSRCCQNAKKIGFLSFGHRWRSPGWQTRTGADAVQQSTGLAVAAEELGADGAYFRVQIIRGLRDS
jgi:hypothetical protein